MEGIQVMTASSSGSVDGSCNTATNNEGKQTTYMGVEGAEAAARSCSPSRYGYESGDGGNIRSISERGKKKGRMLCFGKPLLSHWVPMAISATLAVVGNSAGPLAGRFYFVHGGGDRWIYTWLQTAACPVLLIPAAIVAAARHKSRRATAGGPRSAAPGGASRRRLLMWSLPMGLLLGVDNLLFSWALSYLPASTSTLLYATLLAFNVASSYALFRRRLTGWTVNAAVIVTTSAVLLGLQSSSDRPPHTTGRQYAIGFVTNLLASALYGFMLSLTELAYAHIGKASKPGKETGSVSFMVVIYLQLGSSIVATAFAMVGMAAAGSFSTMQTEYQNFDAGRGAYVAILLASALSWQAFFLGSFGVTSLSSSLLSCLLTTTTLPLVPILAVFFFHDSFNAVKGVSTFLAVWGFVSYIYGGFLDSQTSTQHTLETNGTIEPMSAPASNHS